MSEPNNNNNNRSCCLDQPKTATDFFMLFSMGSVLLGLVLFCVGYMVPRDHVKNSFLSAREQEALDLEYAREANRLDMCVVVGMCFIGLGGVLTSAVFCNSVICGDCGSRVVGQDNIVLTGQGACAVTREQGYGTMEEGAQQEQRQR